MSKTIYDVAQHAGVAISTVSKVLSNRHVVSEATRQKVIQAVHELGYVPSSAARTLAGELTQMISVVIGYNPQILFEDPNLVQILAGIDSEVSERDCVMLLSTPGSDEDRLSAYRRLIRGFRVDGVLIEGGKGDDGAALLREQYYPCVVIGFTNLDLPSVFPDDYEGGRLIGEHLVRLGHRHFGIIGAPSADITDKNNSRLRGFCDVLLENEIVFNPDYLVLGNLRPESGFEGAKYLLDTAPHITAIFAYNDRTALGVLRQLGERGLRVPQDISIVGFDDIADSTHFVPPLTTIHVDRVLLGQTASRLLFDLINGNPVAHETMLPIHLVVRGSTAIAPSELR